MIFSHPKVLPQAGVKHVTCLFKGMVHHQLMGEKMNDIDQIGIQTQPPLIPLYMWLSALKYLALAILVLLYVTAVLIPLQKL